jgi:hypothetical protein
MDCSARRRRRRRSVSVELLDAIRTLILKFCFILHEYAIFFNMSAIQVLAARHVVHILILAQVATVSRAKSGHFYMF